MDISYTESAADSRTAQKRLVHIGDRDVVTWHREIESFNTLEVEAGTNGYHGGDTGHGSRTYLRLTDLDCTDMECRVTKDQYDHLSVELTFGGDSELSTVKEALRWMLTVLEMQSEKEV